jgi:hypothetical protein
MLTSLSEFLADFYKGVFRKFFNIKPNERLPTYLSVAAGVFTTRFFVASTQHSALLAPHQS